MNALFESLEFSDGYSAAVRWFLPDRPRGAVLYLHGIESHGGWFEGSGAFLAERALAVLMPDRRGSGLNAAHRGHAESAERLQTDGRELIAALCARTGFEQIHLVGVSWGGKWGSALAASGCGPIASLSLVAPGIYPRVDLPMGEKLRVAWSMLAEPERAFPLPLDDATMFTSNPNRLSFVRDDPLRLRAATARFLLASRRLDRVARRLGSSDWRGGVLCFLAGRDRIIDNAATRGFIEALPVGDKRVVAYEEADHTLEFEPDPQPFWNELATGIAQFTSA